MQVAPLAASDAQAAHQIHNQSQPRPWSLSTFSDCMTPPYYALGLYDDTSVTGYAILLLVVDEATLMDIAVAPANRGSGGGKRLLDAAIAHCKQMQMATLWLEVRQSNDVAINLYKAYGFETIEVRKDYYLTATDSKEDALIMRLILADQDTHIPPIA